MDDSQDVYLKQVPIIKEDLEYSTNDGIVSVHVNNQHRIQRVLRKIGFNIPKQTKIALDEYSSFVFLQIDGKQSIYQIGQKLQSEFGSDSEPLYERLVTFIDFLEDDRRWVLFKNKIK